MPLKIEKPKPYKIEFEDASGEKWVAQLMPLTYGEYQKLQGSDDKAALEVLKAHLVSLHSSYVEAENLTKKEKDHLFQQLPFEVLNILISGLVKPVIETTKKYWSAPKNFKSPSN